MIEDALAGLAEAFGSSNYILGGAALVVIIAAIVLKILKKDFPFVAPAAKLLLGVARMFKSNSAKVAEEAKAQEQAKQPGLAAVVPLEKKDEK